MGSRRRVASLGLTLLASASCSPCGRAEPEVTQYVIDNSCNGMITAPAALQLPGAPLPDCTGVVGGQAVSAACLQKPGTCTDAWFLIDSINYPHGLSITMKTKLTPSKSPLLDVTLPDPSVTVKAVYVAVPGQPGEVLTAVAGELMVQIKPNHLTSVYAVGLLDAAGDQIAVENATFEATGHDVTTCEPN